MRRFIRKILGRETVQDQIHRIMTEAQWLAWGKRHGFYYDLMAQYMFAHDRIDPSAKLIILPPGMKYERLDPPKPETSIEALARLVS